MGMPNLTDNYQGYDEGDLSKHVDQLKDKQFLLVSFPLLAIEMNLFLRAFHIIETFLLSES